MFLKFLYHYNNQHLDLLAIRAIRCLKDINPPLKITEGVNKTQILSCYRQKPDELYTSMVTTEMCPFPEENS
jgi:hypothetical protein